MPRRVSSQTGVLVLTCFVFTFMLSVPGDLTASSPHQSPQPVEVTNTPLPVVPQGVTTVTGDVGITGEPTVQIDPAQNTVQLVTDADHPLYVRDVSAARQPWSFATQVTFTPGLVGTGCDAHYDVPSGQRLVITQVAIDGNLASGDKLLGLMFKSGVRNPIVPALVYDEFGFARYATTQQLEMYLESGDFFACGAQRTGGAGAFVIQMNFSGYLVAAS